MIEFDKVLDYIKEKGNWRIIIRPEGSEEKKLKIESCKDIVLNSIVSLRPYNYPYYYSVNQYAPISYERDYVQCISDIRPHMGAKTPPMSVWRMYQTGQFQHMFSCVEDYWEVSAGKNVLSVSSTLHIITEIYEFASRIAEISNIFNNDVAVGIELHSMRDRSLVEIMAGEPDSDRLKYLHYRCRDNDLAHQKELTLSEVIGMSKELAMDHTLSILRNFGWSTTHYLKEQQNNLLRITSKKRLTEYPISVDDPARDKAIFRDRLMQEICRRYKYLRRNRDSTEFVFSIEDIRKPGMAGFEREYFIQKLPELQEEEGYIEVVPEEKVRLTNRGVQYCDGLG